MNKILSFFLVMLVAGTVMGQEKLINEFDAAPDSGYFYLDMNAMADSTVTKFDMTFPTNNVQSGTAAMRVDYNVTNTDSYGGYVKVEHWADSGAYFDWSDYENLTVWYYTEKPGSLPGRAHLRINLSDGSDVADNVHNTNDAELWYSFQYAVLDDSTLGWHQLVIPLEGNGDWDGNGFNLTGWAGVSGNGVLDLDKIKAWHLELSISGAGEGDESNGVFLLDKMALTGARANPWLIFNGKTLDPSLGAFTWGQSAVEVADGAGEDPATNALVWTQGDEWANGWSGAGYNVDPIHDLGFRWDYDSLRFKAKFEGTVATCRMQFESNADNGIVGHLFEPVNDGEWHTYALALKDFYVVDGKADFDPSAINVFQFMAEGNSVAGNKIYFDYIWTGSPVIDVVPPVAPQGVSIVGGTYQNVVTWIDVPGETGAVYNVYYSLKPFDDATGIKEVAGLGVEAGNQAVAHVLMAPLTDTDVTYYYAIECVDAAGNASELALAGPQTTTAKGVAIVNPAPPANFVADGDLSEWAGMSAMKMYPSDGSGTVVNNTTIDGDADLSVESYIAFDDNYLYFALKVEDDIVVYDSTKTSYLMDSPDLFIGLYDWHGAPHTSYKRGETPDYHFRFNENALRLDAPVGKTIAYKGQDYAWKEGFPTGYFVEGKISLDVLATEGSDNRFHPKVGMRIPVDYSINDADATGEREGILTYSILNQDQSWSNPALWTHTWIGDKMTDVNDNQEALPLTYKLDQNYPNPFNPTTTIQYSLKEAGLVTLRVYNILGQEVATLINGVQNAGFHKVNFDASQLATGIYVYRISANDFVASKKMLLLK